MKDTIKAKNGEYKVYGTKTADGTPTPYKNVYDGEQLIMQARLLSEKEFKEMWENDESFCFAERFTTRKGTQFEYYTAESDTNLFGDDYLRKVN